VIGIPVPVQAWGNSTLGDLEVMIRLTLDHHRRPSLYGDHTGPQVFLTGSDTVLCALRDTDSYRNSYSTCSSANDHGHLLPRLESRWAVRHASFTPQHPTRFTHAMCSLQPYKHAIT